MKNIVTIWWWNWHSSILKWLYNHFNKNNSWYDYNISAIVSMSDDGRTTWLLMREMQEKLDLHMPPPGDLRRCLFSLSGSVYRNEFERLFETVIHFEWQISDFRIIDILKKIWEEDGFIQNLTKHDKDFLNYKLPLKSDINWHKFGNILMAILYYEFGDYNKMMDFMSFLLDVKWKIIPVTTDKAFIKAELNNWKIIKTQDKISNVCDYDSSIKKIELMECSENARLNKWVIESIEKADIIIIWPWDLFTSIDANFIIQWFLEVINKSKSEKIYILNSNNKVWETTWYTIVDFIDFMQARIDLDIVVWNSVLPKLDKMQLKKFKNDISVKWWDFLVLDEQIRQKILEKYSNINLVYWDYVDQEKVYKYSEKLISDLVGKI